jgi:nucleoside-diphosphate-sugar epimerase
MKILLTGITGFIGTRLSEKIIADNKYELVGMARDKEKTRALEANGIEIRTADLTKPATLKGITQDVDVVIHLAALMRFHAPRDVLFANNLDATKIIAEDALASGVEHFIYASSTEAIGPVEHPPGDESSPCRPTYAYGESKVASEEWLNSQHAEVGLPATILRPTGVIGPGDMYVSLSTIRAIAQGKLSMLPGKADKFVHFTYVDDVVDGILATIDHRSEAIGETIIIAGDDYVTYKEELNLIAHLCGVAPPKRSVPVSLARMYVKYVEWSNRRKGIDDFFWHASLVDDMTVHRAYSNAKAKQILDFKPQFSLEEGLQRTISAYRERGLI